MNSYNVISENADVAIAEHLLVVFTATGVAIAVAASPVQKVAGTNLRPVDAGKPAAIALKKSFGQHYVTVGNATAIAAGDELELAAGGKVIKFAAGTKIGIAREPSVDTDSIIRAVLYAA